MKVLLISVIIFMLLLGIGGYYIYHNLTTEPPLGTGTITINETTIQVEVATTENQHVLGLSYRNSLAENIGMLFVYDILVLPSFWMYGMNFPLDIIWIRDNEIVGIEHDVPVPNDPLKPDTTYIPEKAVTAALEVNAGWAALHGVKTGDTVQIVIHEK